MRGFYERARLKTAEQLVEENGNSLVGRFVKTAPIGNWPGGIARVTKIAPDPAAPDIVFEVNGTGNQAVRDAVARGDLHDGTIGVFDYETVELLA